MKKKPIKNMPSPTWPDAYVVKGKLSIEFVSPELYKQYVAAEHAWHEEMQELIKQLKELPVPEDPPNEQPKDLPGGLPK